MKFVVDESVEFSVIEYLRRCGHDVLSIAEDRPSIKDSDVLMMGYTQNRILVTNDKDFGELIFRHGMAHAGVILFRLFKETAHAKIAKLTVLLHDHADVLPESFIVVTMDTIRIRRVH